MGSPVHHMQSPTTVGDRKHEQTHNQTDEYELDLPVDQLKSPILGVIVVEFLGKIS